VIALNESDVHIWYRNAALLDSQAVKSANQYLSIEERTRRDRLHFEADRRDFTIAHDLLRRALSKYADIRPSDWQFTTSGLAKPSIESVDTRVPALSFSLSHTRGCVACAITSSAPLGVDVERIDRAQFVQEIADRYFSEREAAWLHQCSSERRNIRFVELWTLKEAFLKAVGIGLSGSLTDVSFRFDEDARIEFLGPSTINPTRWHFALFEPVCDVRLGIAVRSAARPCFLMREDQNEAPPPAPIRVSRSSVG
jgi:phosphopantetheinyl transferase